MRDAFAFLATAAGGQTMIKSGADQSMLMAVGMGSKAPKVTSDPFAADNRRVEIGRQAGP